MARVVCLREWLKWVVRERMRVARLEPLTAGAATAMSDGRRAT